MGFAADVEAIGGLSSPSSGAGVGVVRSHLFGDRVSHTGASEGVAVSHTLAFGSGPETNCLDTHLVVSGREGCSSNG